MSLHAKADPASAPPLLLCSSDYLAAIFGPLTALGPTWGEDNGSLISEVSDGPYRIALYARQTASNWDLSVVISPVVRADAVVRFGVQVFRAPFDHTGTATLQRVPAYLLTSPGGPPLELRIEPIRP